jgi:benzodiazapine receptor
MANYLRLAASIIICEFAGIIGSLFTASSVSTWYAALNKPVFNPPGWLFGPVWICLYFLMGISLYIVWNKEIKNKKIAIHIFIIQLALNSVWSILFFGLKSPLFAFTEIIVLWLAILVTIMHFHIISKTASYLLIPYILWVSFAAVLNFFILIMNS